MVKLLNIIKKTQKTLHLNDLIVSLQHAHNELSSLFTEHVSAQIRYLRMATVRASGEVAHGQITSGFRPWDWNTFRKASHDDTDPDDKHGQRHYQNRVETVKNMSVHGRSFWKEGMFVQVKWLTWVCSISHNEHTYGGQVGVSLVLVGHHGPVEVTALYQGNTCYQRIRKYVIYGVLTVCFINFACVLLLLYGFTFI